MKYLKKLPAGSRTYVFEIKTSVKDTPYMIIRKNRFSGPDSSIMVFREHLNDFLQELGQVIEQMPASKRAVRLSRAILRRRQKAAIAAVEAEMNHPAQMSMAGSAKTG
ncbi:MAG: hypothetical protein WC980_01990 [Candidatus Brocadiia bacterium]